MSLATVTCGIYFRPSGPSPALPKARSISLFKETIGNRSWTPIQTLRGLMPDENTPAPPNLRTNGKLRTLHNAECMSSASRSETSPIKRRVKCKFSRATHLAPRNPFCIKDIDSFAASDRSIAINKRGIGQQPVYRYFLPAPFAM